MSNNPVNQSILNQSSKDKFILVLDVPPFLNKVIIDDKPATIEPLQLTVYGGVVPAASVPNISQGYAGQTQHITSMHRPDYSPLTVNFIVDNRYHNYYIMWKWFNGLNEAIQGVYNIDGTQVKSRGLYDYQTNMTLYGLDEYNKKTVAFKYLHAFVTGMGGIEYNYQDSGIITSNVTFQFDQLNMELIAQIT